MQLLFDTRVVPVKAGMQQVSSPVLPYPALPYPARPCSTLRCPTLRCRTLRCSCPTLRCLAPPCAALPCPTLPCPGCPAPRCAALLRCPALQPALPCPAKLGNRLNYHWARLLMAARLCLDIPRCLCHGLDPHVPLQVLTPQLVQQPSVSRDTCTCTASIGG